jgi:hypothetical protein
MGFTCPNAGEMKKENPMTDKHKNRETNFQCLIFLTPFLVFEFRNSTYPSLFVPPPFPSLSANITKARANFSPPQISKIL